MNVNYFAPGLREMSRFVQRWQQRWRLRAAQRELVRAETELGSLGWQQADFDEVTQREVDTIQNHEREQARLNNLSAELAEAIAALRAEGEATQQAFAEKAAPLDKESGELAERLAKSADELAAHRKAHTALERAQTQLDRELAEVERLHLALLKADQRTPETREELARLHGRTMAVPNEKADATARQLRLQQESQALEEALARDRAREAALRGELRELEAQRKAAAAQNQAALKAQELEKTRTTAEMEALEQRKGDPYQQIGRVLADHHLAPMNQPQALAAVYAARTSVQSIEDALAELQAASAAEDRALAGQSLMLWAAIALAALLVLCALVVG